MGVGESHCYNCAIITLNSSLYIDYFAILISSDYGIL